MLIFSRDAIGKMEKHAWHVFPLEAFGYLLGRPEVERLTVPGLASQIFRFFCMDSSI